MTDETIRSLPAAYWRQWSASAISNLGDGINFVAMPLLALSLTDDERLLSLTVFATFVPWLVLALPVGIVVDRVDRQRLMIGANLVRLVIFVGIALAAMHEGMRIWMLIGLLIVIGSCEVLVRQQRASVPAHARRADPARPGERLPVRRRGRRRQPRRPRRRRAAVRRVARASVRDQRPVVRGRWCPDRADPTAPPDAGRPARSLDHRLRAGFDWLRGHRLLRTLAVDVHGHEPRPDVRSGDLREVRDRRTRPRGLRVRPPARHHRHGRGDRRTRRAAPDQLLIGLRASVVTPYLVFGVAQLIIG